MRRHSQHSLTGCRVWYEPVTRYPGAVVTRYGGKSWIDRDIRQRPEAKSTFTSSGHTRQDTQYSAARAQILRYLHTPEHVYPGNSSQRSREICRKIGSLKCWGGGESDFHWILASSLHRLSAGTNSKKRFYPLSLSTRAHPLKSQTRLDHTKL